MKRVVRGGRWTEAVTVLLAAAVGLLAAWWSSSASSEAPESQPEAATLSAPEAAAAAAPRASQRAAEPAPTSTLVIATTSAALADVEVLRWGAAGSWASIARRQLTGMEQLELSVPPGRYRAQAESGGAKAAITVEAAPGHRHDLVLALAPTRTVEVRISAKHGGGPLRGIVRRVDDATTPPWSADAFGRALVDGLGAELTTLDVKAPGYLPATVTARPEDRALRVTLSAAARTRAWARAAPGPVVVGAQVSATGGAQTSTDATGRYELEVPPGLVDVVAIDLAGRSGRARATAGDQELRGVDVVLGDPHRLSGVVEDEAGARLPGARLTAEAPVGFVVARTTSGPDGRFELDGLPPGWVSVQARVGRGARGGPVSAEVDKAEPVVVRVVSSAALWGLVTDGASGRVPGVRVTLRRSSAPSEALETVTDVDGAFRVDDLEPGLVTVTAQALGGASQPSRVLLTAGAALRQDLVLSAPGTIVGRVRGATTVRQVAAYRHMDRRVVQTDEAGHFTFELPAGDWVFSHAALGEPSFYGTRTSSVRAGQRTELELGPEDSFDSTEVPAAIPGTVGATFETLNGRVAFAWIVQDGPAGKAGVRVGDVLERVDAELVTTPSQAQALLKGLPGSSVRVEVSTAGASRTLTLERQRGL